MFQATSPTALRALLNRYGLGPKKGLGQHFLWHPGLVEQIAAAAELDAGDVVIEIGPGLGILTAACARRAGLVIGVEIDSALFPLLEETLREYGNVRLVAGDARKVDFEELVARYAPQFTGRYKVVGNLPYYLTSPLILRILDGGFRAGLLIFMVQREVAMRLTARPGGKDYGSLSVAVQYHAEPELLFTVSPRAFFPAPGVASAVVRLRRRLKPPAEVEDKEFFFQLFRAAFRYRRKTVRNALLEAGLLRPGLEAEEAFREACIAPERRGETLSLAEFAALSNALLRVLERKV
ncbi:MAG: 16S rRNA (adenine(1518)-N(6)/adenine(1519)-N(6))-dimethyltransferase RsmA [Bacillota bacterium]|nr:16S rRNA (adenine(1518)-N(6)/adenine(1519)-N(6))-dimethyltransferase RsmA [Bacillota bacterium]